jgi:putative cell wall-binding protein
LNRKLAALAVFTASMTVASTAGATADAISIRIAGTTRYETAQMVSTGTFQDANVALLVSGTNYPDALASAYLAGISASPVLLTDPNELSDGILETLDTLGVSGVIAIGGEGAISSDVLNELQEADYVVDRIAGENRFSTARQIAEFAGTDPIGSFMTGRAAIVVNGFGFADALASGPIAAAQGMPILLTTPEELHVDAENALLNLDIEQVLIIGGTAAVSDDVFRRIFSLGIDVRRIAGDTRQATAAEVANVAIGELLFPADRVMLARSDNPADALAGGIRGGQELAPLLLTEGVDDLGLAAGDVIVRNKAALAFVEALGGTAGISDAVLAEAVALARS